MQTSPDLFSGSTHFSLNLKCPLAFIDLETTGVNVASDRIVEIAILKVLPLGNGEGSAHPTEMKIHRINPGVPIPLEASKIHGIYDKDVKDCPSFSQLSQEIFLFLDGCDLAGYNSNRFDIPMLAEEFLRAGKDFDIKNRKLVDVQSIFHKMEQRTLIAAYKFYCGKELTNAHNAEADITATYEVFLSQLNKYKELKNDIAFLHDFTSMSDNVDLAGRIVRNEQGDEVFNFGKHKGKKVTDVFRSEPSYFDWMMNGDFPLYTKKVITAIRLRAFNNK